MTGAQSRPFTGRPGTAVNASGGGGRPVTRGAGLQEPGNDDEHYWQADRSAAATADAGRQEEWNPEYHDREGPQEEEEDYYESEEEDVFAFLPRE